MLVKVIKIRKICRIGDKNHSLVVVNAKAALMHAKSIISPARELTRLNMLSSSAPSASAWTPLHGFIYMVRRMHMKSRSSRCAIIKSAGAMLLSLQ
jgi:hypothetical protein